ncbi:MAG TPA: hypothetical protein VFZ73_00010 [Gemmatimonadaceae bacterium]
MLTRDLFFGMRIRNALQQMGYRTEIKKTETDFEAAASAGPAALALIDFNGEVDWAWIERTLSSNPGLPIIAFGAHTDTQAFQRARAAGVTRVISNSAFSQQLPDLVKRYARQI